MTNTLLSQEVRFDRALIEKYDRAGPRYTSYPTAPHFHEGFGPAQLKEEFIRSSNAQADRALSLYLHIPFCDTVCYYCACNKIVTPDRSRALPYLEMLIREIELMGQHFSQQRPVTQIHFGGGSPSYLTMEQTARLWTTLRANFSVVERQQGEFSIESDPRESPPGTIARLAEIGFNRISFGVQDLDVAVQKAVNRIQPLELTHRCVQEARAHGFGSINIDLIYGLPLQTEASFLHTLDVVIRDLDPDRLAIFNYAHLPQYFSPQRRIDADQLPPAEVKLRILEQTIARLLAAGYVYVGMDHFAKPTDELAMAQRHGSLHRNFQGYTTHAECDLVGLGLTSISQFDHAYAQNYKTLPEYYARIESGELATFRGVELTRDDRIRRDVIMRLLCDFQLDRAALGERLGIDFHHYFAAETPEIARMTEEGLLEDDGNLMRVTAGGRLLIRNVCMAFDWYLANGPQKKAFSKTI
ncbi:MAG: oxygen-independent coproporphyrinogen III oxidase [Magnetococcales bacterium]|nr:oxygen-independent coproporphyrinogen III oxidase [Magnetococcales bacterium]NGZ07228.1 oxygen-independent coproporphyrinogen III oxidase [Magnetococcales bacterium]